MASIVLDAAIEGRGDDRTISYSRRRTFYADRRRYLGTDYGYDTVVPAVDALARAGLLEEHRIAPGGRASGWQSSFRAGKALRCIELPEHSWQPGELIRLKDKAGGLIGYRDTERIYRERRFLENVNEAIAALDVSLESPNATLDGALLRFGGHVVHTRMNSLYRVFNGGWNLGGRFYGGWWQQVPGAERPHITIEGAPSGEEDFAQLHPRLLYSLAGKTLSGDAYTLFGWDRAVCKRAFNILLNASNYHAAKGALVQHLEGDEKRAADLIAAMKHRHRDVARHFHSGIGLRLQNMDAVMARSILAEMTIRRGIPCLPVHDSFIVPSQHRGVLLEAMEQALARQSATVGKSSVSSGTYAATIPHMGAGTGAPRPGDVARIVAADDDAERNCAAESEPPSDPVVARSDRSDPEGSAHTAPAVVASDVRTMPIPRFLLAAEARRRAKAPSLGSSSTGDKPSRSTTRRAG